MNVWLLLLTPLLVLPIVTLFRFVGCGTVLDLSTVDNLSYPKYLMGDAKDVTTQKNPAYTRRRPTSSATGAWWMPKATRPRTKSDSRTVCTRPVRQSLSQA